VTDSGLPYAPFVEQELKAERERRATLDSRGQAVVTTSGALVTLLTAIGAVVFKLKGLIVPDEARYALVTALACFIIAAFFGILVTINFKYDVASKKTLQQLPRSHSNDSAELAQRNIVATNVKTIITLRG
jgi:Flp pilus assembly protein TadB